MLLQMLKLYPAISGNLTRFRLNLGAAPFRYAPPDESFTAIAPAAGDDGVELLRASDARQLARHLAWPQARLLTTSEWATVGAPSALATSGKVWYELTLETVRKDPKVSRAKDVGRPQVGWASAAFVPFVGGYFGERHTRRVFGVGDDARSWAVDGVRGIRFHNEVQAPASKAGWSGWLDGDVIGVAADIDAGAHQPRACTHHLPSSRVPTSSRQRHTLVLAQRQVGGHVRDASYHQQRVEWLRDEELFALRWQRVV